MFTKFYVFKTIYKLYTNCRCLEISPYSANAPRGTLKIGISVKVSILLLVSEMLESNSGFFPKLLLNTSSEPSEFLTCDLYINKFIVNLRK